MWPYPGNYITAGRDGVIPPILGGTIGEVDVTFTYAWTAAATAFTLPQGCQIAQFRLVVNTAFNGSATLSVGITGTAAYFLSAASALGTIGPVYSTAWLTSGKWLTTLTTDTPVTITLGGTASVGSAILVCQYKLVT